MHYRRFDTGVSHSAIDVVVALCADYPRRKKIGSAKYLSKTNKEELFNNFKLINEKIDSSISFIEEGIREIIILDIGAKRGYGYSMASSLISKDAYYARKNQAILEIAKAFNLVI